MIDLEKEKILAREWYDKCYGNIGSIFNSDEYVVEAWVARARLAQSEINKEREQATEYYTDCEYLKAEINDLKQKLEKLESDEFVLVPKKPTEKMINAGERELWELYENVDLIYKAMIEAVEKDNVIP